MAKLTQDGILKEIEKLGLKVKGMAEPSNYPFEKRYQAKRYEQDLKELRGAYWAIQNGADAVLVLNALGKRIGGIEGNRVKLIELAAKNGFEGNDFWNVVDDQIQTVR